MCAFAGLKFSARPDLYSSLGIELKCRDEKVVTAKDFSAGVESAQSATGNSQIMTRLCSAEPVPVTSERLGDRMTFKSASARGRN